MEVAQRLQSEGCSMDKIWEAFAKAHVDVREALSPPALGWNTYEDAAGLMGMNKTSHVLTEVLGFKTVVASPQLAEEDRLPSTVYCGSNASAELRALEFDLTPLR